MQGRRQDKALLGWTTGVSEADLRRGDVPSSRQRGELAAGGICRWLFWGRLGVAGSSKQD
ncbi:hypothetical protein LCI18_004593 [Fusarium solani-melongenae]|uniref:Uncharacterized protein n=1 Tax=Fusarium solani subsp. cucurbitae TaxID=2747967 RepID=A0ACD3YXU0_FUSSC|nr:hypothetical protein LCI18_004593 [Fusarium solani-melongenae]